MFPFLAPFSPPFCRAPPHTNRYTSRQYVEEVHFQSAPFAKLKEGLSSLEWVEPMKLSMFEELDVGF